MMGKFYHISQKSDSLLESVILQTGLKNKMEQSLSEYNLSSVSVAFNPLDDANVKIVENLMIGAVLLGKILGRARPERSTEDAVKYGIASYTSSVQGINDINQALGLPGSLTFPVERTIEDERISEKALGFDGQDIVSLRL